MARPILSRRDRRSVVSYAMDRIEEALVQAWLAEFCNARGIEINLIRGQNCGRKAVESRMQAAIYLCSIKGVRRTAAAKVMHRHYDMIRHYLKPALRKRRLDKNRLNAGRWRRPRAASADKKVNVGLTAF